MSKSVWIENCIDLIRWPKHIKDSIWWIGQFGIYRTMTVGFYKPNTGHKPFDLRCNCCFVCSWILKITIYPIMKVLFRNGFQSKTSYYKN